MSQPSIARPKIRPLEPSNKELADDYKFAIERSWNWFQLSATQRMQTVNFFFVVSGILWTAIAHAASGPERSNYVLAGCAVTGFITVLAFGAIEKRTLDFVEASRRNLQVLEDEFAQIMPAYLSMPNLHHDAEANEQISAVPKRWRKLRSTLNPPPSYRRAFRYLRYASYVLYALAFLGACGSMVVQCSSKPQVVHSSNRSGA